MSRTFPLSSLLGVLKFLVIYPFLVYFCGWHEIKLPSCASNYPILPEQITETIILSPFVLLVPSSTVSWP
jgi:hypothetical protein